MVIITDINVFYKYKKNFPKIFCFLGSIFQNDWLYFTLIEKNTYNKGKGYVDR